MKKDLDIYNLKNKIEATSNRVMRAPISERNKELIIKFRDFCFAQGLSGLRIDRYLCCLLLFGKSMTVDFDKATKDDIMKLVGEIQGHENHTAWTKSTHKTMLKRFYKWLKGNDEEYPPEVKWIKATIKRSDVKSLSNDDLITPQEVEKLVDVAEHPRDKALISVLYESGARIGELCTLQIGNVKFDEHGVILNVQGKTGARPIRIINSTHYLTTWLQSHPLKRDNSAPLWINVGTFHHNQLLKYNNVKTILTKLFAKAGIKKRGNAHMFRHSRATFLSDYLTEFQMNQFFGWVQGSNMPSTYVHMSGANIDAPLLELNGIKAAPKPDEEIMKPSICPKCSTINPHKSKFCNKCAGILDVKTALELENKTEQETKVRHKYDDMMNSLMEDPEFVEVMSKKMSVLGLRGEHNG